MVRCEILKSQYRLPHSQNHSHTPRITTHIDKNIKRNYKYPVPKAKPLQQQVVHNHIDISLIVVTQEAILQFVAKLGNLRQLETHAHELSLRSDVGLNAHEHSLRSDVGLN